MPQTSASALCYALPLITGIIFLVLEPYNKNKTVRFHAFQSIFMGIAWIILRVAVGILVTLMASAGGLFIGFGVVSLVSLAFFVLWIYMIIVTYQGKTVELPIIGALARQQA